MEKTAPFWSRIFKCLVWGLAVAVGGAFGMLLLCAALLSLGLPDGWIPFFAHFSVLAASLGGGLVAGKKRGEGGILIGGLTGGGVLLLHLAVTLLWGEASLSCLSFGALELMGGTLGGIFGVNLRR